MKVTNINKPSQMNPFNLYMKYIFNIIRRASSIRLILLQFSVIFNIFIFFDSIQIDSDLLTFTKYNRTHYQMEEAKSQSVYIWGLFNSKQFTIPTKIKQLQGKNIIDVASGGNFYLAVSSNGQLYGWGNTKYSRYGIQSNEDIPIPRLIPIKVQAKIISTGNWHSMLIDSNNKAYAAGHNKQGACGTGNFENCDNFTEVKSEIAAKDAICGDCFSLIITVDQELYSCGHSDHHGHKIKEHINKPKKLNISEQKIVNAAAGFNHALAVTQKGKIFSWGNGVFYQLGHNSKNDEKQPRLIKKLAEVKIVQVSCTRGEKNSHSMALSQAGQVYTWGAGYKGKLGHAGTWSHEDAADEPQPRKMETINYKVTKVSAGGIHSNILNDNGEVLSFGCGSDGRLGHEKSNEYVYLYREGVPKVIDTLKSVFVTNLESSYYHNICIGYKR